MTQILFTVPGEPIAQPRPKFCIGSGGRPRAYVHSRHPVHAHRAAVRLAAMQATPAGWTPLTGAVMLAVNFVLPRPLALTWKKKPMPRLPHEGKPDLDNLLKAIADAIRGVVYRDDAQVARLMVQKWIASGDEQPHTDVAVMALEDTAEHPGPGTLAWDPRGEASGLEGAARH
jgi:Holliday junction resolvase RusA-like endonuclease